MRLPLSAALAAWALCLGGLSAGVFSPAAAAAQNPDRAEARAKPAPAKSARRAPAQPASEIVVAGVQPAPEVAERPSNTVAHFANWVIASRDNQGLPFVIIDKVEAGVFVFAADGGLIGVAPALMGFAYGDDSSPGVGERELSGIPPEERTTPAGRFMAGLGPSVGEGEVLWVDYETALSLHHVIVADRKERRLQRLQSPTPLDNRITYGCINVPAAFYEKVVRPAFTGTSGVVYILPEMRPLRDVFPAFRLQKARSERAVAAPSTIWDEGSPRRAKRAPRPPRRDEPSRASVSRVQSGLDLRPSRDDGPSD